MQGNSIFHVDSSFNPRCAGLSCLHAHTLPPPGHGGNTDFADTRAAFNDIPTSLRQHLQNNDYIGTHSLTRSRKKGRAQGQSLAKRGRPRRLPLRPPHALTSTREERVRKPLHRQPHAPLGVPNPSLPRLHPLSEVTLRTGP
jgi:hypothetical protein